MSWLTTPTAKCHGNRLREFGGTLASAGLVVRRRSEFKRAYPLSLSISTMPLRQVLSLRLRGGEHSKQLCIEKSPQPANGHCFLTCVAPLRRYFASQGPLSHRFPP